MKMNKVIRLMNGTYELTTETDEIIIGREWLEKKTGNYHIKFPENSSGREYIRISVFEKDMNENGEYFFPTKTEKRGDLGWKGRMTEEERMTWNECVFKMKEIEEACKARKPRELTEEEKLLLEIEKAQRKLAELRMKK